MEEVERYEKEILRKKKEKIGIVRLIGNRKYESGIGKKKNIRIDYVVVRG